MKFILGLLLILAGICGGIYFGLWWAFIGGIIQIIDQIKAPSIDSLTFALGVAKIMFSGVIGWFTFMICIFLGGALCSSGTYSSQYSTIAKFRRPPQRNRNK